MTQSNETNLNTLRDADLEAIAGGEDVSQDIDTSEKWYKNFLKMRRRPSVTASTGRAIQDGEAGFVALQVTIEA